MMQSWMVASAELGGWMLRLDPTVFSVGPLTVKWYGVSYIAGFVIAWLLLRELGKRDRTPIPPRVALDAILVLVMGVLLGGRLGYVLFYQPSLLVDVSSAFPYWGVLAIQRGGMASHGAMIGIVLACFWLARGLPDPTARVEAGLVPRVGRSSVLHCMDLACLLAPPGLFLGRLANFVNGELLGRVVAGPGEKAPWWAVRFPQELGSKQAPALTEAQYTALEGLYAEFHKPGDTGGAVVDRLIARVQSGSGEFAARVEPLLSARHPSQLYQALAEGIVVGTVLWLIAGKTRRPGVVTAWFLLIYGVLRIIVEQYWRLPDPQLAQQYILGLTRGQLLSVGMLAAGAGLLVWAPRSKPNSAA